MRQVILLTKIKFRSKCKFYKSLLSLSSMKHGYIIFVAKEVLTFVLTALVLSLLCEYVDSLGLDEVMVEALFAVLIVVELFGSSKFACGYTRVFLDLYRSSSTSYGRFLRKTVVAHCLANFCFKLPVVLLIIGFSCVRSLHSLYFIVPGLVGSFLLVMNAIIRSLTKDITPNFRLVVSLLKYPCKVMIFGAIFFVVFSMVKGCLCFTKTLLTSSGSISPMQGQIILSTNFLTPFIHTIDLLKEFCQNYAVPLVSYLSILTLVSTLYNLRCYAYLWHNKVVMNVRDSVVPDVSRHLCFPSLKMLYRLRLNNIFVQIAKTLEVVVFAVIEIVTLYNMESDFSKFLFVLWLYFIGSSNHVRALFVVGRNVFSSYTSAVDLCYWRLAGRSPLELYEGKLQLLLRYTNTVVWCESIFACAMSFLFVSDKLLAVLSLVIIICLRRPLHFFSCSLASFSSFLTFAHACKSQLSDKESEEAQFAQDSLHNLFKLPFVLGPMMVIFVDYVYSFLTVFFSLPVLCLLFVVAWLIEKQIGNYVKKAGDMLEKVNVPDWSGWD